jgi:tol-pal system protein YbgF
MLPAAASDHFTRATVMMRSAHPALVGAIVALFALPAPVRAQMSQSDMVVRLDQLEADMRRLTGAIEELQYRNQQLEQALRQMQSGGPPRPGPAGPVMAPASPPPVGPAGPAVVPAGPPVAPGRRSDVFDPAQSPNAPGAPRVLGSMSGNVGALPGERPPAPPAPIAEAGPGGYPGNVGSPQAGSQIGAPLDLGTSAGATTDAAVGPGGGQPPRYPAGPQLATLPPSQTPRDEFDLAYGYVLRKDYALAAQAFQEYLRKYPSDRMAGEAQFWLGESLYQDKNYQSAAEAFVTMTKKFATSPKQPDTLLRLGQSLAALQQKDLACATYAEVGRKFPHAAQNVRAAVEREQKRVRC